MDFLAEVFQLLMVWPICVYLYHAGVMQIGSTMALGKAWNALVAEIRLLFAPIRWLLSWNKMMKNSGREKSFVE